MDKNTRILKLYDMLNNGKVINKVLFSFECGISERSFERDIEDIRLFLSENFSTVELLYDKLQNGYYLSSRPIRKLSDDELLPILKIMLESQAFRRDEMLEILDTLMSSASRKNIAMMKSMIHYEVEKYQMNFHNKAVLKIIWDLCNVIYKKTKIRLHCDMTENVTEKDETDIVVSPIFMVFMNHYFYLIAFVDGNQEEHPKFFRIDKINSFEILNQSIPIKQMKVFDVVDIKNNFSNKNLYT